MKKLQHFTLALALCLLMVLALPTTAQAAESPALPEFTFTEVAPGTITITAESGEMPVVNASGYLSMEQAAEDIRAAMIERKDSCTVYVKHESHDYQAIGADLLTLAFAHTGNPKGGDYLAMHCLDAGAMVDWSHDGYNYLYTFYFEFLYTTTAAEEAVLDNMLSSQLNSMNLMNKSDYEKVSAVYNYMLNNITFDEANLNDDTYLLKHTAYAAFVNKTAVTDGLSSLLYRMLLELQVDNRIILGETSGGVHCWNLIKLGNVYYNADIAMDIVQSDYSFFLRNTENFIDHYPYFEYNSVQFHTDYPISGTDYVDGVEGEPEYVYVWGICGDDAYWAIDRDRNLTIFGTGATDNYHTDDAYGAMPPWIPWKEGFRQVVVDEGITLLGECAFYDMVNVKKVTLPDSLQMLGAQAFGSCYGLAEVNLGNGLQVIGSSAFAGCVRITSLNIPDSVTHIQADAFGSCTGITQITWGNSLEVIGENAFNSCTGLTELRFPASLTRIEANAFSNCNGLITLTIPSHITYLSGFSECDNLETVTLNNSHIGPYAFSGCDKLNHLVIPDSVTHIGDRAFYECASLNDIAWGASLEEIGESAFANILGWSELALPEGLKIINEGAFSGWENLTKVIVPDSVETLAGFNYSPNLTTVVSNGCFTRIGTRAFSECPNLQPFPLPDGLLSIGTSAFRSNDLLTEVVIPENVDLSEGHAFYWCQNLERVVLNNSGIIGSYSFAGCSSLKEVVMNGNITELGMCAFDGYNLLTSITFPASLTKIEGSAFDQNANLSEIRFTGNAPEIEYGAFDGITATAYYPGGNPTWTADKFQDYGGTLTWVNGHVHELADGAPVFDAATRTHRRDCLTCDDDLVEDCTFTSTVIQEATLQTSGIRKHTCSVCGGSYEERFACRIFGANRYETAFSAADMLKAELGVDKFGTIIVASGLDFADALTGSYLAAVKSAPILLVNQHFMDEAAAYINENLAAGGRVYLLGGELAIAPAMEEMLTGHDIVRLAGANRLETNLLILNEAGVGDEEILVCYSHGFADSLSASAVGKPILMVNRGLTPAQKEFLAAADRRFVIIGGESAVSADIEALLQQYGTTERIGGSNRYETSINVAKRFFENPEAVVLAYGANFPDGLCGGPLAYSVGAPLILTRDVNARMAAAYTAEFGISNGSVLGGTGLISDESVNTILAQ